MGELITLGIETSCDETSAAVLRGEDELLGHVIFSQDVHRLYGGVVPELASRVHLREVDAVVGGALAEAGVSASGIGLVAVTAGPGLIGALLVGVAWGKGLAWSLGVPVIGVHHMEAHLFATALECQRAQPPFVALLVSGGHTLLLRVPAWGDYELLGATRDDAAGEAFDKAAKLLGPPYPGGPSIQTAAASGDPSRHPLPRPLVSRASRPGDPEFYDFSFSGLKTALRNRIREVDAAGTLEQETSHLAAAFQEAAVDTLVTKTMRAVAQTGYRRVVLGGGVANNRLLRERLIAALGDGGELFHPSPRLATDNAAMIARAGVFRHSRGETSGLDLNARPDLPFPGSHDDRRWHASGSFRRCSRPAAWRVRRLERQTRTSIAMLTLLHVSDLHFGPPYHEAAGEALLRFAHDLDAEVIVASGDFTQRAKEEQFAAAREFLDQLPDVPIVVTPGNHDVPLYRVAERLFDPYRHYKRYISEELDTVLIRDDAAIVALNSTAPRQAVTNGRVHRWQLELARDAFASVPEHVPRIVVAHHHFAPPPDFEGAQVMPKAKRALDVFTSLKVDAILGGHLHRAYIGNSLDVYAGMDREHGILIAQSGTSTSRRGRAREREKNSFNVLRIDRTTIKVTHYMFFDVADGFLPVSRHLFYRGGRPPVPGEGERAYAGEGEHDALQLPT